MLTMMDEDLFTELAQCGTWNDEWFANQYW